ncbi:MAG: hypothetical protein ACT4O0_09305 [Pseudonocardia sp.]|jgi:hypothetical protein
MTQETDRASSGGSGEAGFPVQSHIALRATTGVIAVALPLLVISVTAAVDGQVLSSISASFHHRYSISLFVGSMFAFAAFLWAYQYTPAENRLGNVGAVLAAGVAIFPTRPGAQDAPLTLPWFLGTVHFVCAAAFFLVLFRFCRYWSRSDQDATQARTYRICSWVIVAGLVVAGATQAAEASWFISGQLDPYFLLAEVVMVEAFGVSWLVRGGAALASTTRALAVVGVPILLIVFGFGSPSLTDRAVAGALGILAAVALLAVLWPQRPGASRNRFGTAQTE